MNTKLNLDYVKNISRLHDIKCNHNISIDVINRCERILTKLHIQPKIYPTERNSIQLQYKKPDKSYLEFEIQSDKTLYLFVPQRKYNFTKQETISIADETKTIPLKVNEFFTNDKKTNNT